MGHGGKGSRRETPAVLRKANLTTGPKEQQEKLFSQVPTERETGAMDAVPVGDGVVDWPGQLQAFVEDGYEGHLCLETHWRPARKIDEELLNRPGGRAFSASGEEASRVCIQNLFAMIEKLRQ